MGIEPYRKLFVRHKPTEREAFYFDGSREGAYALLDFLGGRGDPQRVTRDFWRVVIRTGDENVATNVESGRYVLVDAMGKPYVVNRVIFDAEYDVLSREESPAEIAAAEAERAEAARVEAEQAAREQEDEEGEGAGDD